MTDAEFLAELHDQVAVDITEKCEAALDLMEKHNGRVPPEVWRVVKALVEAVQTAEDVLYAAERGLTPSAEVLPLRPVS
jgi:hypothetical protein